MSNSYLCSESEKKKQNIITWNAILQPKDSKVLKLKEDAPASDRKLRSSDSPKPQEVKKPQESTKKRDKTENLSDEEEEKAEVDLTNEQDNSEENVKEQTEVTQSKEESIVNIIEVVEEAKQNEKEVVEKKSPEDLVEIEVVVEVEPEVEGKIAVFFVWYFGIFCCKKISVFISKNFLQRHQ